MGSDWAELDDCILNWANVRGIQLIRDRFDCSIHEAIDFLAARMEELRQTRPEDFAPEPEGYAFYS